ncbi:MAG TPA: phytanoyl-CoA dioxygenase family protein [Candidatus Dormibacteraeota bacterium]|jgi:ectoine hydroxylase-related dioxygenase (phytanoyl-CoA dioxygenase family)|nr:phytanoyl-CoA dioxygenase family protein [Candidatus Dormibacteraeota bacterium]
MNIDTSRPELATPGLVQRYQEQGFVVVKDAITSADIDALRAETVRICRGDRGDVTGRFTRAGAEEADEDVIRRYLCIHMVHKMSPVMREALSPPAVVDVLTQVIGPDVKAMQSMLFIKAEGKPGQAWHQDEKFIPTRDRSLTSAWIALDDATTENGCLWVLPGSHRPGVIYPDREHDDVRFDCTVESFDFPYRDEDAVPVELPAGAAIVFNGYLLHRSLPNRSRRGLRRSLANHYMSASSLLPWHRPAEGQAMAMTDYRDIVMVAGKDPYAWKGFEDIARPHVRPDREGGCDR